MNSHSLTPDAAAVNSFSMHRSYMSGICSFPAIKCQLLIYSLVSVAVYIIYLLMHPVNEVIRLAVYSMLSSALSFMISFAPIVFARYDVAIETLLPAKAVEKFLFMVVYSFILIPIAIYVPYSILNGIVSWISPDYALDSLLAPTASISKASVETLMESLNTTELKFFALISKVDTIVPSAACLLAVISYRRNRAAMGIVWAVVSMIGFAIIGGLWGFYMAINAFRSGELDAMNDMALNPDRITQEIIGSMKGLLAIMAGTGILAMTVLTYLTYRKIKNRQI